MNNYIFTRAENKQELQQLSELFNEVFKPEKVGELATILTLHLPGMETNNWFIAKEKKNDSIVSGFALIPWQWQFEGISLKVAEMGIVGTLETHRGQGLMKQNNQQFEQTLENEEYDLAVIQGIPGFYNRLGYHYALPMEHHTELPLHGIEDKYPINIRKADDKDIPFLVAEANKFGDKYSISSIRNEAHWQYILNEGTSTEYASEVYIIEDDGQQYYLRILQQGFGQGLHIAEVSLNCLYYVQMGILDFAKQKAIEKEKPYIRLNLANSHPMVKLASGLGATTRPSYGWQIKIVNPLRFIKKMKPILEERLSISQYKQLSATVMLDCYSFKMNLTIKEGKIDDITSGICEADYTMSVPEDLLTPFILGYCSWQQMQAVRPDIFPADQFLRFDVQKPSETTAQLIDVLFPPLDNWINGQY